MLSAKTIKQALERLSIITILTTGFLCSVISTSVFYYYHLDALKKSGYGLVSFLRSVIAPLIVVNDSNQIRSVFLAAKDLGGQYISGIEVVEANGNKVLFLEPKNGDLVFEAPLNLAGQELGVLRLFYDRSEINKSLYYGVLASFLSTLIVTIVGLLLVRKFHSRITNPISKITKTLEEIAEAKDYTVRLMVNGPYEIQRIVEAVNIMMAEIQQRDDNLERMVILKTKELVDKQRELETSLNEIKRLSEAKNQFLANLSHEIRTPLNAVYFLAESLLKQCDTNSALDADQIRADLKVLHSSSKLLLHLVNDLLDFSRIITQKFVFHDVDFDLFHTFEEVVKSFLPEAKGKNLDLIIKAQSKPMFVKADPTRISQVLFNLVGNAIKFTESGFVKVSLDSIEDEGVVDILFKVEDSGIGIPPEKLNDIFEIFHQVDSSYTRRQGGLGLGLAITKHIVSHYNGKIKVSSEVGKGSCFEVLLSLPKAESAKINKDEVEIPNLASKTILIVEDNPVNVMIVKRLLESTNANILVAHNGKEALEILSQNPHSDLILMDIQMPIMDGVEATKKIREGGNNIKIVALTAHAFNEEIHKYLEIGCNSVLTKPIKKADFYSVLSEHLLA